MGRSNRKGNSAATKNFLEWYCIKRSDQNKRKKKWSKLSEFHSPFGRQKNQGLFTDIKETVLFLLRTKWNLKNNHQEKIHSLLNKQTKTLCVYSLLDGGGLGTRRLRISMDRSGNITFFSTERLLCQWQHDGRETKILQRL